MFGYTIIKKSELKKLQEESSKYLNLVSYGYWFSGFRPFYKVLEKFIKGEVGSHNVWEIREELARSLGTDRYGRPLNDPKIFIPDNAIVSDTVIDELREKGYDLPDQHEIANKAAKVFLDRLIYVVKKRQ
jgi:hypothetical protein